MDELAVLLLLAEHRSLASDQVADHLAEQPHAINGALRRLRDQGLVDALAVGEADGHATNAVSYWWLTEKGRQRLDRLR